jgi:hypothetical protein
MQRSKNLAMMFLLGAVLVGGALGFTADRVWMRDAAICSDPKASRALLYDRLELTGAQRAAWDSILDDRHRQFDSLFKPIRPQMDSIRARSRAQMRALLTTPDQRERFEAIIQPRPNEKNEKRETSK